MSTRSGTVMAAFGAALIVLAAPADAAPDPTPIPSASTHLSVEAPPPPAPITPSTSSVPSAQTYGTGVPAPAPATSAPATSAAPTSAPSASSAAPTSAPSASSPTSAALPSSNADGGPFELSSFEKFAALCAVTVLTLVLSLIVLARRNRRSLEADEFVDDERSWPDAWRFVRDDEYDTLDEEADDDDTLPNARSTRTAAR